MSPEDIKMSEVITGTCKWFGSSGQAYGYITYHEGSEIYVHYTQIKRKNLRDPKFRDMKKNDTVEFVISPGYHNDGTQAVEVEIITHADNND
tara:strand:+ start:560 stop:835 length:276 start_codon:yes stop_codon:yes gene_type:complete